MLNNDYGEFTMLQEMTANPFDSLTSTERAEYEAWSDTVTPSPDVEAMFDREQQRLQALFQEAKAKFDTLHVFSQPDSLTRRGNVLILRRRLQDYERDHAAEAWLDLIKRLFDGRVVILNTDIDRKLNLRIHFRPLAVHDDEGDAYDRWLEWHKDALNGQYGGWR